MLSWEINISIYLRLTDGLPEIISKSSALNNTAVKFPTKFEELICTPFKRIDFVKLVLDSILFFIGSIGLYIW